jgi:MFS family permease
MRTAVLVGCLGCILLGVAPWLGVRALAIVAMGVLLLPALPVILTAAEQLAGAAAGTAGAIIWMAGNLGGLVVALLVQILVHHPLAAFLAMAAISVLGLPLAARLTSPVDVRHGEPATAGAS